MILERFFICFLIFLAPFSTVYGQNSSSEATPAGTWLASCEGPKLKFDEDYEICLMNIDTGAYDPGYFSSELYFAVDYLKDDEAHEFDCTDRKQLWDDWGINLYSSFSFIGSYTRGQMSLDAGSGYSMQNSYQLKSEFIIIDAEYEIIGSDQLKIVINGVEYSFFRMIRKE